MLKIHWELLMYDLTKISKAIPYVAYHRPWSPCNKCQSLFPVKISAKFTILKLSTSFIFCTICSSLSTVRKYTTIFLEEPKLRISQQLLICWDVRLPGSMEPMLSQILSGDTEASRFSSARTRPVIKKKSRNKDHALWQHPTSRHFDTKLITTSLQIYVLFLFTRIDYLLMKGLCIKKHLFTCFLHLSYPPQKFPWVPKQLDASCLTHSTIFLSSLGVSSIRLHL